MLMLFEATFEVHQMTERALDYKFSRPCHDLCSSAALLVRKKNGKLGLVFNFCYCLRKLLHPARLCLLLRRFLTHWRDVACFQILMNDGVSFSYSWGSVVKILHLFCGPFNSVN